MWTKEIAHLPNNINTALSFGHFILKETTSLEAFWVHDWHLGCKVYNTCNDEFRQSSYLNFRLVLVLTQCWNLSSDHTLFFTVVLPEFSYECSIIVMTGRDNNGIIGSLWGKNQANRPVEWQGTTWICCHHSKCGHWETRKDKGERMLHL